MRSPTTPAMAALALALAAPPSALAAQATLAPHADTAADSVRVERLAALGRAWSAARFFHPRLASGGVDWDSALVAAIPRVRAARTAAEYAAAVDGMLAALGDPSTRVVMPVDGGVPRPPTLRWTEDSTLVITITDGTQFLPPLQLLQGAGADIARARRVVFDIRLADAPPPPDSDEPGLVEVLFGETGTGDRLVATPLAGPSERRRMHSGFPFGTGSTYRTGWLVKDGMRYVPAPGVVDKRVAFVVNENSELPFVAHALQRAGRGVVVAEGTREGTRLRGTTMQVPLADGLHASIRVGAMSAGAEDFELRLDALVPRSAGADAALERALALVREPASAPAPGAAAPAPLPLAPDRKYAEMTYPPLEYRLLAAFRIYGTIRYFHPYRSISGEDWEGVLREFVPRMERARDSLEYSFAVAGMVTHIHDSHGFIDGRVINTYRGRVAPGVQLQYVEGVPVVIRLADDSAVARSGVRPGDVLLAIDGASVAERRAHLAPYIAASTPQALDRDVAARLLRGPDSTFVVLRLRDAAGRVKEVRLQRLRRLAAQLERTRSGPILRMLPGNIGYADLDRLPPSMVDSMFDMFRGARAIVFDVRGYPQGTAWQIAPRLTDREGVVAASFRRPVAISSDGGEEMTYAFTQRLPRAAGSRYRGRTLMLVDERTQSQAEHTGLFFKAANGTTFVGSPTAGANGDVTSFTVPGDIDVTFSGHDVRFPDGRQLQRVGLVPDVLVRPTIAGIRAGRDEVLERAVQVVRNGVVSVREP